MKPPTDPLGNVARATCDTTESVVLGRACSFTARKETPRKSVIAITPSTPSVVAAFFPCGRRKALTPFAIASTPVSAVEPDENARSTRNTVTAPVPAGIGFGTTACGGWPVIVLITPTTTSANIDATNAYVGTAKAIPDSRTPRRLTSAIPTPQPSE